MRRHWKFLVGGLVLLIIAIVVWLGAIHFPSKNKLSTYKAELIAKGEKLEISEVLPPAIPASLDRTFDLGAALKLLDSERGINGDNKPYVMRMTAPGKALAGWAQPLARGLNRTSVWEVVASDALEDQAGLAILRGLTNGVLFKSQFDYSRAYETSSYLAPLKYAAQKLGGAASLNLHNHDPASAQTNLLAMLVLSDVLRDERTLISQLVRIAIVQINVSATWELLQADHLTEDKLAWLQKEWESLEFIQSMENMFVMERAISEALIERMRHSDAVIEKLFNGPSSASSSAGFGDWLAQPGEKLKETWNDTKYTAGKVVWRVSWSYDDELRMLQTHQIILDAFRAIRTNGFFQPTLSNMLYTLDSIPVSWGVWSSTLKLDELRSEVTTIFGNVGQRIFSAAVSKRIVVTAIALKRYQLKHGNFPIAIADLAPEFLATAPLDPVDGKPLRYRRNPDGTFLLYSIGIDAIDDGGDATPVSTSSKSFYWQTGHDWVWPTPATQEEVDSYFKTTPK